MRIYNSKGLTLIEMLTMLTIVIILTTVAVPSMRSIVRNRRLMDATESLNNSLQYARSEAIKRNANVYVSFVTGDSWCYGINTGASCNCTVAGNCNLGATTADSAGQLSLSATGYGTNFVYFQGSNGAAHASGTLTYTVFNDTPTLTINIGRLGNATICGSGISGYTGC